MKSDETTRTWEERLGAQVRGLRLRADLTQRELADRSGIALNAVKHLESGRGTTLATLVRVLRTLDRVDWLRSLAPSITISPLQALRARGPRQRASRSKD